MHASARVMVATFALLLVAAFAIVPGTARANINKPTWAAGDFWVYSFVSGSAGLTLNGTLRLDVTGTESVTLNQTDYPSYHVAADLKIPLGHVVRRIIGLVQRSEEHTSELQSLSHLVCRLPLENKKSTTTQS